MKSGMKIGVTVGDVMTRDFISVNPDVSLLDCVRTMVKKRVGSLVLQKEGTLKGLITEKDILWAVTKKSGKDLYKIKCSEISPRKIVTIKPSVDLMNAIKVMQKSKFRRLPVVIKNKLVGMLTLKDILRVEPALFEIAAGHYSLQIKEQEEKMKRKEAGEESNYKYGLCQECGREALLEDIDGAYLCKHCTDEM